jgi:uncharacterized OsmC-like protein
MITSNTTYNGGLRTTSVHRLSGNRIITDAPPDNEGKGEAFSPTDLLATSLACCMLTIMGIAARNHGFDMDGAIAETEKVMTNNPRRVSEIRIRLTFPHNRYNGKEKGIIEHITRTCPVALSLHPDMVQHIQIIYNEAEGE